MVGSANCYRLSTDLRNEVHSKCLYYLAQVGFANSNHALGQSWKSATELNL